MVIKRLELALFLFLSSLTAYCAMLSCHQYTCAQQMIRLRVIADGNDLKSQSQKLIVRDAVLEYCDSLSFESKNAECIRRILIENRDDLNKCVQSAVHSTPVFISLTEERYPSRSYQNFSLPAGRYTGIQVRLGSAQGKNWWCVVYPSFCTKIPTEHRYDKTAFSFKSIELVSSICEWLWN